MSVLVKMEDVHRNVTTLMEASTAVATKDTRLRQMIEAVVVRYMYKVDFDSS